VSRPSWSPPPCSSAGCCVKHRDSAYADSEDEDDGQQQTISKQRTRQDGTTRRKSERAPRRRVSQARQVGGKPDQFSSCAACGCQVLLRAIELSNNTTLSPEIRLHNLSDLGGRRFAARGCLTRTDTASTKRRADRMLTAEGHSVAELGRGRLLPHTCARRHHRPAMPVTT